ncbi:MAG: CxxxxCH/CxxCH domain-containing protein [Pseudomonadota bacterium]
MKKMMRRGILVTLAGFVVAAAPAFAAQSPHGLENNIDCLDCHADHQGTVSACADCHDNATGANYSKLDAPEVESHVGFSCQTCHDPHTSAQCTLPLAGGSFANYLVNGQTTTFFINSLNVVDPAWSDPAKWNSKNGNERGLIFTVALGLLDTTRTPAEYVDYSAEVVAADAASITVNGVHAGAELTGSTDFSLIYGQLVRTSINGKTVFFNGPASFAVGDGFGPGGDDSTPDGVCQVCHTQTKYWRNDGSLAVHNSGHDCTTCHDHNKGFNAGCNSCHGNPPVVDMPQGDDGLVLVPSATGSITAGAHALHAGAGGFEFSCDQCHAGGMPESAISGNNRIQIGFAVNPPGVPANYDGQSDLLAPYSYEGVHDASVTTGGSLTCSNVYCHSNGGWVSTGRMNAHVTPPWNTQGPLSCDNCHPYPMRTGPDDPRKDTHTTHAVKGYGDCGLCHSGNISNHQLHSNKVYDVVPAATFRGRAVDGDLPLSFNYAFAPGGGTCSSNSCHAYWGYSDPVRWGMNVDLIVTPYLSALHSQNVDRTITFNASRSSCYEMVGGVAEPRTCSYEWNFGGNGAVTGGNGKDIMTYQYGVPGDYNATLTMRESVTNKTNSKTVPVSAVNVAPPPSVLDFATTVNGKTVMITAANLPADVVRAYIYWGDRKTTLTTNPLAELATGINHTYSIGNREYSLKIQTIDSAYKKVDYTVTEDPDLLVAIP